MYTCIYTGITHTHMHLHTQPPPHTVEGGRSALHPKPSLAQHWLVDNAHNRPSLVQQRDERTKQRLACKERHMRRPAHMKRQTHYKTTTTGT